MLILSLKFNLFRHKVNEIWRNYEGKNEKLNNIVYCDFNHFDIEKLFETEQFFTALVS